MDNDRLCQQARELFSSGRAHYEAGELHAAIGPLKAAADACRDLGAVAATASCNMNLAFAYLGAEQYGDAIAGFRSARPYFVSIGSLDVVRGCDEGLGLSLEAAGSAHLAAGEYPEAIASFGAARSSYASVGMSEGMAFCDQKLAGCYGALGSYQEAISRFEKARSSFASAGLQLDVAVCDGKLGLLSHVLGDYTQAIRRYKSARRVFESQESNVNVASCNRALGTSYRASGDHKEAIARHEVARASFVSEGLADRVADCDLDLGVDCIESGKILEAINRISAAQVYFQSVGLLDKVAYCDLSLGKAHASLGDYRKAVDHYKSARELYVSAGMLEQMAMCDVNLAVVTKYLMRAILSDSERAAMGLQTLTAAVQAVVFIDSMRFTFSSSRTRKLWSMNRTTSGLGAALSLAVEVDNARFVVDLILAARAVGTYALTMPDPDEDGAVTPALELMTGYEEELPQQPAAASEGGTALAASAAVCRVLGVEGVRLDPPPHVLAVEGHIVLAEHFHSVVTEYKVAPQTLRSSFLVPIA